MIIDGKKIAQAIKGDLRNRLAGKNLTVALVAVGIDAVGEKFISMKKQTAEGIGVTFKLFEYEKDAEYEDIELVVRDLSLNQGIQGIVVQLPLPESMKSKTEFLLSLIPPEKDIDSLGPEAKVFSPVSVAVGKILELSGVELPGKKIAIVGKGKLVGLPTAKSLAFSGAEIYQLDRDSKDMNKVLIEADIVISGAGRPGLIKPEMIKQGVVLIDAGTSESNGQVVGDIELSCADKASLFAPVPGGVGPVALACLFENLAELQNC